MNRDYIIRLLCTNRTGLVINEINKNTNTWSIDDFVYVYNYAVENNIFNIIFYFTTEHSEREKICNLGYKMVRTTESNQLYTTTKSLDNTKFIVNIMIQNKMNVEYLCYIILINKISDIAMYVLSNVISKYNVMCHTGIEHGTYGSDAEDISEDYLCLINNLYPHFTTDYRDLSILTLWNEFKESEDGYLFCTCIPPLH